MQIKYKNIKQCCMFMTETKDVPINLVAYLLKC